MALGSKYKDFLSFSSIANISMRDSDREASDELDSEVLLLLFFYTEKDMKKKIFSQKFVQSVVYK